MGEDNELGLSRHGWWLLLCGARLDAVDIIGNSRINFARSDGAVVRFTFVYEICIVLFFLPHNHGIFRRHLDQHVLLTSRLRHDYFFAQTFLPALIMMIV